MAPKLAQGEMRIDSAPIYRHPPLITLLRLFSLLLQLYVVTADWATSSPSQSRLYIAYIALALYPRFPVA